MRVVTFGEIMLRLSTPRHQRFRQASTMEIEYGGGESNVAVSLANYGQDVSFVSRLPDNDLGECALRSLRAAGIDTTHIVRGGKRLGLYFLETGAVQRPSKVLYDREDSSMATVSPGDIDWDRAFEGASWFHWSGITPAVSASAAEVCREACRAAAERGITISVDLNHRSKLWQYGKSPAEVMPELVDYCDVIVGGSFEAAHYFGVRVEDDSDFLSLAKALGQRFPKATRIVTTLRDSISASHNTYSALLWDGTELHSSPTYQLTHIVDRVGGGDSFMGGLIHGLLSWPGDLTYALRFAVAAAALKHTIPGDVNLVTAEEVISLMQGDGSGRVRR
ncbi:2-dehydro-3-deoxygluconokinase [Lewinella marina]|uniref:2-dehydro-3-deoxygluconokinase n=1 Tax=Neolewinella marina TaxID=438751 RepID=A0A2G0CBM0_9BACT|nr:sugar kinase [Neolewinella marina]NJB87116.1 2-dehydro-3-deoxygluconokinase [Neolewinella marina]PHK97356.1 2-dehydro-3-deoxygluconokinase [Neolewinella marina]